jgi:hypothetical protein
MSTVFKRFSPSENKIYAFVYITINLVKRFIFCIENLDWARNASGKAMRRYRETLQTRFADFGVDPESPCHSVLPLESKQAASATQ